MRPYAPEDMKIFEQRAEVSLKCDKCGNTLTLHGENSRADIAECAYFGNYILNYSNYIK